MTSYGKYVVADSLYCDNDFNDFSERNDDFKLRTSIIPAGTMTSDGLTILDIGNDRCGLIIIDMPAAPATKTSLQINSLLPKTQYELKWCFYDPDNSTVTDAKAGWTRTSYSVEKLNLTSTNSWKFHFENAATWVDGNAFLYLHLVRKQKK